MSTRRNIIIGASEDRLENLIMVPDISFEEIEDIPSGAENAYRVVYSM